MLLLASPKPLLDPGHLFANILSDGRCCAAAVEQYTFDDTLRSDIDRLIIDAASSGTG